MKTLIAAVAFAAVFAAPAFAQSVHAWGWKGALDAPGSAKSAYAASFDSAPRHAAGSGLCSDDVMAFERVLDALQLQCQPGEPVVPDQLQLNFGRRPSEAS